ncbi:esterase [Gammaproteobacteria bacterium]|nr:esterase [Gammaproteobacteria bacterium]MDB4244415.1 esterase [Gammaproteobacteria bacterium]
MTKTILYFHGFKSSSKSSKAQSLKNFIAKNTKNTKIIIPDLDDNFQNAHNQIEELIRLSGSNIVFMGSSLGGYYASYFSQKLKKKAVLINPAVHPLKDFEVHLGENENYSSGSKFNISSKEISFVRTLSYKKLLTPNDLLILLESGDEILKYNKSASYFSGAYIDIAFGGNHSYSSFKSKFHKIQKFLDIK